MGLFSWLFQRPAFELLPDRIFLTRSAMLNDFTRQCQAAQLSHDYVLLVTHFAASLRNVCERLNRERIPFHERTEPLNASAISQERHGRVPTLALAEQLVPIESPVEAHDKSLRVALMVAEHHPLRCHDEHIERFASTAAATVRLTYFASLEDPLMQRFAGAWTADVLQKLGMKPDEVIESPMITRRIVAAQRKIESSMFSDTPADSAAEWCERNLPNL